MEHLNNFLIMHFDLDAFFASVEKALNPLWANKALVVAADNARGVVAAASYEARVYGIKSAMSSVTAKKLCPHLIFADARFQAYQRVSKIVMTEAKKLGVIEPISLDEAFVQLNTNDPVKALEIARDFKQVVKTKLNLSVSVGIGSTKLIAKLASDDAKPNGVRVVKPENSLKYLNPINVNKIWGVGKVTEVKLKQLNVKTVKDLQGIDVNILTKILGVKAGEKLHALSFNQDAREVEYERERKSVSQETTFNNDISDIKVLKNELSKLSSNLIKNLNEKNLTGSTLHLKIKYGNFTEKSKSYTAPFLFESAKELEEESFKLLESLDVSYGLRLIGIGVSNFKVRNDVLFEKETVTENINDNFEKETLLKEVAHWGLKVKHNVFGIGFVESLTNDEITVRFDNNLKIFDADTKKLMF